MRALEVQNQKQTSLVSSVTDSPVPAQTHFPTIHIRSFANVLFF